MVPNTAADLVQEQAQRGDDQPLPQIAEHDAEQQDVGDGQIGGRVGFVVAGQAVHIDEHLKGLDDEVVLQLGGGLEALVAVRGRQLDGDVLVDGVELFHQAVGLRRRNKAHQEEAVLVDAHIPAQLKRAGQVLQHRGEDAAHLQVFADGLLHQLVGGGELPVGLHDGLLHVLEGLPGNAVDILRHIDPLEIEGGEDLIHLRHMDLIGEEESPLEVPVLAQRLEEEEPVVIVFELAGIVQRDAPEPDLQVLAGEDVVQADIEVFHVGQLFHRAGAPLLGGKQQLLLVLKLMQLLFKGEVGYAGVPLGEVRRPHQHKAGRLCGGIRLLDDRRVGRVDAPALVHLFHQFKEGEQLAALLAEGVHLGGGHLAEAGGGMAAADSQEQVGRLLDLVLADGLLRGKVGAAFLCDLTELGENRQVGVHRIVGMIGVVAAAFLREELRVEVSALKAGDQRGVHLLQMAGDLDKVHFFNGHLCVITS